MNNAVVSDPSLPAPTKGVEGAAISVLMEEDKVNNAAVSDPSLPGPTKEDEGALPEAVSSHFHSRAPVGSTITFSV